MIIRESLLNDAADLARVRQEGWKCTYRGIVPDAVLDGMNYEKDVQRWTEILANRDHERFCYTSEIENQVTGFCTGGPCRDDDPEYDGEIYAIYVLKAQQGRGTGRALMNSGIDWLKKSGCRKMLVWVLRDNTGARGFYEKLGGAPVRQRLIQIGGVDLPELGYGFEL
jgi:GNAT superfamily N-acetyltransferase